MKPADKANATVIMDKSSYFQEGERQLSNSHCYENEHTDLSGEVIHRVNLHAHYMIEKAQITEDNNIYLTRHWQSPIVLYGTPKKGIIPQTDQ